MKIEIDQSGKVEDTAKDTVIAFSNGNNYAIKISSTTKRKLQQEFRQQGRIKLYIYRTFASLLFLLLKEHIHKITYIIIDIEYFGKEDLIGKILEELCNEYNLKLPTYIFKRIGNTPKVHYAAYDVLIGKKKEDKYITYEELVKLALKKGSKNA